MKRRGSGRSHRGSTHKKETPSHHAGHKPYSVHSHHHHTHKLLYVITILLIVLILAIIFSYPLYVDDPSEPQTSATITIASATCTWQDTSYEICETISWQGPDGTYAKPYIPGGESPEEVASHYENKFTYCQTVGTEDGYRIVRAMLFDEDGIVKDIGSGVSCNDMPSPPVGSTPQKITYQHVETGQILAQQAITSRRTYAEGTYTLEFPDTIRSCDLKGVWRTENDPWGRIRRYCHEATGSFSAHANPLEQYVTNDPDYFGWAGIAKPRTDPPPMLYENYALHMTTCNHLYYRNIDEYYVKATVSGFGTTELTFHWEYFDDETQPQVYFDIEADCTLEGTTA